jgi:hypothetical protein
VSSHAETQAPADLVAKPGTARPERSRPRIGAFVDRYLWIFLFAGAGLVFGFVWQFLPHVREGVTLPEFLLKVSAFVLAILGVAVFPKRFPLSYLLLSVPSLVFLGFIIPRMMYLFLLGPQMEPEYYTYLWSLNYPGILLSIALAHRIGGGSSGAVVKLGLNGLILVFSGYLELMWFQVNPWSYYDMPSIPHVEVILGFKPTYTQLFVFALCHIPLLLAVNLVPMDRWVERVRSWLRGEPAVVA